jgi:hypothetical protein
MAQLDFPAFEKHLKAFDFQRLFLDVLGWNRPASGREWQADRAGDTPYTHRSVAELGGVVALQVVMDGGWPDEAQRLKVWRHVAHSHAENLLIFTNLQSGASQSQWYWVKRDKHPDTGKPRLSSRRHDYFRGQPVDLFASKLQAMVVELSVLEAARRIQAALDVQATTKKFFNAYEQQHLELLKHIEGIAGERDRRWYASVLLNRLMFVWFLQKKLFLDGGNGDYLRSKLAESQQRGPDRFFGEFLKALFFEAFAKPEAARSAAGRALTGKIPYLNGGLFLPHKLEQDEHHALRVGTTLRVADVAFEGIFRLFASYSWHLDDTPGGAADEINPDVLGYIFEKYINQKAFGAYYTRPEITGYLAERSIHQLILERIHEPALPELGLKEVKFDSVPDLLAKMDARTALRLVNQVLPSITILDPAVGSGAFLVAALKCLINVYYAVVGRAEMGASSELKHWLAHIQHDHPSVSYYIKRRIVTDNLYGVDIMEEACEIAKLRLFLSMVSSVRKVEDLEPLPNIDFNILPGNSLVGLMRVDGAMFDTKSSGMTQMSLFSDVQARPYSQLLVEKNRLLDNFRHSAEQLGQSANLQDLREQIDKELRDANAVMNEMLRDEFEKAGIKFEEATWDADKKGLGKPKKRDIRRSDIDAQSPFHWGYVFDDIMQRRGGFDIILANPPWEVFKPQAKEFFADHSELVSKNRMTIKEFEKEQAQLLKDSDIRRAWLAYESRFPHMSAWYRGTQEYCFQSAKVGGKKTGSDINLYKIFVERSFALLREGGHCGIVIPSSLYKDLGATGLRNMLFDFSRIDSMVSLSNERFIFEGVHHSFGLLFINFTKGGRTEKFRATFRINPREAISADEFESFVRDEGNFVEFSMDLVREMSPETRSLLEFRGATDISIVKKFANYPSLGEHRHGEWNLRLCNEFHMTIDSKLFEIEYLPSRWPLWEGKQFHQYDAGYAEPRYWLDPTEAKDRLRSNRIKAIGKELGGLGQNPAINPAEVRLDCDSYRIAFRDIARSSDARTVIAAVLPPGRFCPHTVSLEQVFEDVVDAEGFRCRERLTHAQKLYVLSLFNSYVFDWLIRQSVTTHVSFFFIYNMRAPRLDRGNRYFDALVQRAARLTCLSSEFDQLACAVGLRNHTDGAYDPAERARLRAEIDGLVAHLYGLSEDEFAHILKTFPLVPEPAKVAARNAFRDVERGLIQ